MSLCHTDLWNAQLCSRKKGSVSLFRTPAPDSPPPHTQRTVASSATLLFSQLQTRTPSELECSQSNGALCFINPLFIKVHQLDGSNQCTTFNTPETPKKESNKTTNARDQHLGSQHPQICRSVYRERNQSTRKKLLNRCRNSPNNAQNSSSQTLGAGESVPRFPPSHPPLPCFTAQCSAPPIQQRSMPEKIAWINEPKEEEVKRSKPFSRLGSSVTTGLLSSSSKRFSISSLASIPRQSLPLSLTSLSSSPSRSKASSLLSDYEDAQCHLALEEKTIETAIRRSQLLRQNAIRSTVRDTYKPSKTILVPANKHAENPTGEVPEGCSGASQRLSDMSLSTDSSDSLDFSQSSAFFIPLLHDPSPPTMADFDNHLPLSLPPSHLRLSNINIDDEDDEDEDEEDPIFGISIESDHEQDQEQDQDLTMLPPGSSTRRRSSASAVVLQKALRGNLRKMSGVFTSLLTPDKRAVRKVRELSRDKNSYFGSLVQEYLSYMNEGAGAQAWQSYTSCLELLQTVRQFITQMKSYLRQSSEMEPSIESLVPEDQIGKFEIA